MIVAWLKKRKSIKMAATGLYQALVAQSRDPKFYTDMGVADTLDGRFDLISLHGYLVMQRLSVLEREGSTLSQAVFDLMFKHMNMGLRETGVGDMGIPKHMKRMMQAFNGRAHSYSDAIKNNDPAALARVVARNVYRAEDGQMPDGAVALAEYIQRQTEFLNIQDAKSLLAGNVSFMDLFGSSDAGNIVNG